MKNHFKIIVAVFGITIATFGNIYNVNAQDDLKKDDGTTKVEVKCKSYGYCGKTDDGMTIDGRPVNN